MNTKTTHFRDMIRIIECSYFVGQKKILSHGQSLPPGINSKSGAIKHEIIIITIGSFCTTSLLSTLHISNNETPPACVEYINNV